MVLLMELWTELDVGRYPLFPNPLVWIILGYLRGSRPSSNESAETLLREWVPSWYSPVSYWLNTSNIDTSTVSSSFSLSPSSISTLVEDRESTQHALCPLIRLRRCLHESWRLGFRVGSLIPHTSWTNEASMWHSLACGPMGPFTQWLQRHQFCTFHLSLLMVIIDTDGAVYRPPDPLESVSDGSSTSTPAASSSSSRPTSTSTQWAYQPSGCPVLVPPLTTSATRSSSCSFPCPLPTHPDLSLDCLLMISRSTG